MRLNAAAMFFTRIGILWGACILFVGVADVIWPSYRQAFLQLCASIYPGYHPGAGFGSVLIGTLYALVDGAIGGAIFGGLYKAVHQKLVVKNGLREAALSIRPYSFPTVLPFDLWHSPGMDAKSGKECPMAALVERIVNPTDDNIVALPLRG